VNQKEADKLLNERWKNWIKCDFSKLSEIELDMAWDNNKKVFKEANKK